MQACRQYTFIEEPSQKVVVDIIRPLVIPSSSWKHFILTAVYYVTQCLETVAQSFMQTARVTNILEKNYALLSILPEMLTSSNLCLAFIRRWSWNISWSVSTTHKLMWSLSDLTVLWNTYLKCLWNISKFTGNSINIICSLPVVRGTRHWVHSLPWRRRILFNGSQYYSMFYISRSCLPWW